MLDNLPQLLLRHRRAVGFVAILIAVAVCTASIGLAVWAGTFWFVGSEAPA